MSSTKVSNSTKVHSGGFKEGRKMGSDEGRDEIGWVGAKSREYSTKM